MQSPDPGLVVAEPERAPLTHGAALWWGDSRGDAEELQKLVQIGLEKGLLNYDEIAAGLEDVELVEGETHKHPPHEQPPPEEEKAPKLDLSVEPSLDSLRLFLREIGKVPLLTADQEVYLAKRIE